MSKTLISHHLVALTPDSYSLQRIQVYFSVEQLIIIIVVEVPLGNNPVYVWGIANYTCKK